MVCGFHVCFITEAFATHLVPNQRSWTNQHLHFRRIRGYTENPVGNVTQPTSVVTRKNMCNDHRLWKIVLSVLGAVACLGFFVR